MTTAIFKGQRGQKGQCKPTVSSPCDVRWPWQHYRQKYEEKCVKNYHQEQEIRHGKMTYKGQNQIQP